MKTIIAGVMGLMLMTALPVMAADQHSGHSNSAYCTKHCNATQLGKEVKALENQIMADKAALKGGSGEKLATVMAKKEQIKKHLAQHEKEFADVKAELDKAEAELNQMETK